MYIQSKMVVSYHYPFQFTDVTPQKITERDPTYNTGGEGGN